jgi:hypothetical protein
MNDPRKAFINNNPFLEISWNCVRCKKELQITQYIVTATGEINDICNSCSKNSFDEEKYCGCCKQYLNVDQFYKRKDGLQNNCKMCYSELSKYRYMNKKLAAQNIF